MCHVSAIPFRTTVTQSRAFFGLVVFLVVSFFAVRGEASSFELGFEPPGIVASPANNPMTQTAAMIEAIIDDLFARVTDEVELPEDDSGSADCALS